MQFNAEFIDTTLIWKQFCLDLGHKKKTDINELYQSLVSLFPNAKSQDDFIKIAVLERRFLRVIKSRSQNHELLQKTEQLNATWLHHFKNCSNDKLTVSKAIKWIKDNSIDEEELLNHLAERCAAIQPAETAENFREFHLKPNLRNKLAETIAKTSGIAFSRHLVNFDLEPSSLPKFVNFSAESSPQGTALCIGNYSLDDTQRFEAASKIGRLSPRALAQNIKGFNIPEEEKRYLLALQLASVDGESVMANYQAFEIKNPKYAEEIFLKAFTQNPKGCVKFINKLEFLSEQIRFECLKLAFSADATKACKWFQASKITKAEYRFALVCCVVEKNSWEFLQEIERWDIQGDENNFILAKQCAESEPYLTALKIKQFNLSDVTKRNAILQLCARFGGPRVLNELSNFEVSENFQIEAAITALKSSPAAFLQLWESLNFPRDIKDRLQQLALYQVFVTLLDRRESVISQSINGRLPSILEKNKWFQKALNQQKEKFSKVNCSFQGALELLDRSSRNSACETTFNTTALSLANKLLQGKAAIQFLKLLNAQDDRISRWMQLCEKIQDPALRLVALYLVENGMSIQNLEAIISLVENHGLLNDDTKKELLLFTLDTIVNDPVLTKNKNTLLSILLPTNNLQDPGEREQDKLYLILIRINELILYGYKEKLNTIKTSHDLENIYLEAFREKFNFYRHVDNFPERYSAGFQKFAPRNEIFLLAQRLTLLPPVEKKEAMRALRVFLCNLVEETLSHFRYDSKLNNHLKTIFAYRSDVELLWRQNRVCSAKDLLHSAPSDWVVEETDEPQELLRVGDIVDHVLSVTNDPHMSQCLLNICLDGKYKAIVVKSKNKIIGACLLRLMCHEQNNNHPIIYRGKIITSDHQATMEALIKAMAQKCKMRMGLPVVSIKEKQLELNGVTVKSLDSVYNKEWLEDALSPDPVSSPYIIMNCLND